MKQGKQSHSQVNHFQGFGHHDRLSPKTLEPLPLEAIIPFNGIRYRFTLDQLDFRNHRSIGVPMIATIDNHRPFAKPVYQSLEGSSATITNFPVQ